MDLEDQTRGTDKRPIVLSSIEETIYSGVRSKMRSRQVSFKSVFAELRDGDDGSMAGTFDRIAKHHFKRIATLEEMKDPQSLVDRRCGEWYAGPGEDSVRWNRLKQRFLAEKKWNLDAVRSIDRSSSKVLGFFCGPYERKFQTKGLVVGYVQSGKTANFTAVMSKAADEGYKLFIILAGLTNSLREQTQERMFSDLPDWDEHKWRHWTNMERDFEPTVFKASDLLDAKEETRHLIVVKKNASRLRRLIGELQEAELVLNGVPTIIIDDECDQASVNASGSPDDPSTINRLTKELIDAIPRVTYVGYTATPYANVLIDPGYPGDLYPRDFITALPKPDAYFGAEEIFGRSALRGESVADGVEELDMIRLITVEEESFLRPAKAADRFDFYPSLTPSLERAISYFILVTATKQARGNSGHSTMLVHTTMYAQTHLNTVPAIKDELSRVSSGVRGGDEKLLGGLERLYMEEKARVPAATFGRNDTPWKDVRAHLEDVLDSIEIKVENGLSDERVHYPKGGAKRYIVVGGNILARGLTLEGLVVSFFLRTSSQYDTLMQMGRWFGYRGGWEDLPRIWMTPEMKGYFRDMSVVEAEIRRDIARYNEKGITPTNFATRIRTHSIMRVTARNKMLSAKKVNLSYSGSSKQTTKFRLDDKQWLEDNWAAAAVLVDSAVRFDGIEVHGKEAEGKKLLRNVPVAAVLDFLDRYEIHEDHPDLHRSFLKEYIQQQVQHASSLTHWDVGVVLPVDKPVSDKPLGHLGRVETVKRTRLAGLPDKKADIGALLTKADAWLGMEGAFPTRWNDIFDGRAGAPPLLLLYPINKESAVTARQGLIGTREDLNAPSDVIGVAFIFPEAPSHTAAEYISVDVSPPEQETIEYTPETDD